MIKKAVVAMLIFCVVFGFYLPLTAEPGGEYRIEEAEMTIRIPQGWIVFTRNTPQNDPDIDQQTFDYDMYINNMIESDIYLTAAKPDGGSIFVQINSSDVYHDIGNLTEKYLALPEAERKPLLETVGKEMSEDNVPFIGAYYSDEKNKQNNYVYAAYKDTVDDEPFLWCATVSGDTRVVFSGYFPNEEATQEFYDILASIHYVKQPTIEQVTKSMTPDSSSQSAAQPSPQSKPAFAVSWMLVASIGAMVVLIAIIVFLMHKSRKKN